MRTLPHRKSGIVNRHSLNEDGLQAVGIHGRCHEASKKLGIAWLPENEAPALPCRVYSAEWRPGRTRLRASELGRGRLAIAFCGKLQSSLAKADGSHDVH